MMIDNRHNNFGHFHTCFPSNFPRKFPRTGFARKIKPKKKHQINWNWSIGNQQSRAKCRRLEQNRSKAGWSPVLSCEILAFEVLAMLQSDVACVWIWMEIILITNIHWKSDYQLYQYAESIQGLNYGKQPHYPIGISMGFRQSKFLFSIGYWLARWDFELVSVRQLLFDNSIMEL